MAADFDGDGYTDLSVHQVLDKKMIIYQGNPEGRLQQAFELESGGWGIFMVPGDVTGDGKLDLVAARTGCYIDDFIIMANISQPGEIAFEEPETVFLGTPDCVEPAAFFPNSITIADFTGDGYADLAVTGWWMPNTKWWRQQMAELALIPADGDGRFERVRFYHIRNPEATADTPLTELRPSFQPMDAGDFNEDGYMDITAGSFDAVGLMMGKEDGFHPAMDLLVIDDQEFVEMLAEDVNGDGYLDAVALSRTFHKRETWPTLWVFLGDGKGDFTQLPPTRVYVPQAISEAGSMVAADFNQDGLMDLGLSSSGQVAVLYNQGGGRFACSKESALSACERFAVAGTQVLIRRDVQAGDFNGDGWIDLAYGGEDGKIRVLLNQGPDSTRQATRLR